MPTTPSGPSQTVWTTSRSYSCGHGTPSSQLPVLAAKVSPAVATTPPRNASAPAALEARGARVVRRGCSPDGHNINHNVGALHPPGVDEVRAAGAQLAICLDGDADRVALVCPEHGLLDGDDLIWLLRTRSPGPLVGTVMSNGGLEAALDGRLIRSPVGDAHVAEAMRETGASLGAEPSGHVLFADGMPTGDGLYAALRVLSDDDEIALRVEEEQEACCYFVMECDGRRRSVT